MFVLGLIDASGAYRIHVGTGIVAMEFYLVCLVLGGLLWYLDHPRAWHSPLTLPIRELEIALMRLLTATSLLMFAAIVVSLALYRLEDGSLISKFALLFFCGAIGGIQVWRAATGKLRGREFGTASVVISLLVLLVLAVYIGAD